MIIEFLKKQNEEILQFEPIESYLKQIEENNPTILANFESQIFNDSKIAIKVGEQIIRIQSKSIIPKFPGLFIKVYDQTDSLVEEITTIVTNYQGARCIAMNHIVFDRKENIIDRQYIYQNNCLKTSKERTIEVSVDEIAEIIRNRFDELSEGEKNFYREDCGYTEEQTLISIKQKTDFLYILKRIEEKRNNKTPYQVIQEKPSILLKKYE